MKKNYALLLATFCASLAWSQPVLNASDFQDFAVLIYRAELNGLTPGPSGANQVWDFSSLNIGDTENSYQISSPVASAPFAAEFPSANYSTKSGDDTFIDYELCKLNSTQLERLGISNSIDFRKLINTHILFTFPYTYNTVLTDTWQNMDDDPHSETSTYDGYGTLITPFGTYTDVIRRKIVEDSDTPRYIWYNAHPFYPLLGGYFNGGSISIGKPVPLAVAQHVSNAALKIYPNPAKNEIRFLTENILTIEKITITDLLGKTVLSQTGNTSFINIEGLTSGMYILEVYSGNQKIQSKLLKE